jgi:hypothetical protein
MQAGPPGALSPSLFLFFLHTTTWISSVPSHCAPQLGPGVSRPFQQFKHLEILLIEIKISDILLLITLDLLIQIE